MPGEGAPKEFSLRRLPNQHYVRNILGRGQAFRPPNCAPNTHRWESLRGFGGHITSRRVGVNTANKQSVIQISGCMARANRIHCRNVAAWLAIPWEEKHENFAPPLCASECLCRARLCTTAESYLRESKRFRTGHLHFGDSPPQSSFAGSTSPTHSGEVFRPDKSKI